MQYQLKRIQDGSFAKEFMDDQAAGAPKFKKLHVRLLVGENALLLRLNVCHYFSKRRFL